MIVIAEVPGITPDVVAFADRVADVGCTAVLPHLFGVPGEPMSGRNAAQVAAWCCVSREFATWAAGRTSPVTEWLRALGRHELSPCGGPGVGAVGMCMTSGFALAMMVDDSVLAPVLRQELGDAFVAVEIDSSPGNPHGIRKRAHSVLTEDFVDEPGHPTRDALDRVLGFLQDSLLAPAT